MEFLSPQYIEDIEDIENIEKEGERGEEKGSIWSFSGQKISSYLSLMGSASTTTRYVTPSG
jgi:hypothetical protein